MTTNSNQHTEKLAEFDRREAEAEHLQREAQEERREYVNRHNLNKTNDAGYTRG
ncbi:hypothetical protein [Phage vB_KsaM-C1]|nr:hypothetical protein [Phage vB_KsaM-C1]